ncbi:glycosyltransferase [Aerosakkonemataceae cyanobacterium BLCC-F154]|uniref:Glycosyltransferase n=1 Tax=Floridaenema fluviatile BLCC-F154 TaxID=3153640 RepID=A0ABV4YKC0_9CYAN
MVDLAIFLMDLGGGGAERVMINLAHGFAECKLNVDLVLVKPEGPYLSQISPQINLVHLKSSRLILSLPSLVRYLEENQPKVLLSALEDTNFVALWARKLANVSTKVVVTVHNHLSQEAENATSFKRRMTPTLVKWFYPLADRVIAVSEGVAKNLIELGVPSEKTTWIYNPIVSKEMLEKLQEPVSHPWLLPNQPPVILGVGRLTKQKDFATLIRAFAQVKQEYPAKLIILGEGNEQKNLTNLVLELNLTEDVVFPGFVANPYSYMAHASVLVLSSAWEGFGNVLVEAMAAGTPVVSTDCESGPAEILAQGKYGKLVPVGNVESMAQAILTTLKNPPNSNILKQRSEDFSLTNAIIKYQEVLKIR